MVIDGDLNERGFATVSDVVDSSVIADVLYDLEHVDRHRVRLAGESLFAMRNLLHSVPAIRMLAASPLLRSLVEPYLGVECFAVRAIYFDKLPGANWKVPWHQDLTVALARRCDVEGFRLWTVKAGVVHAQAPIWILERMLAVRLHLDDCRLYSGPLRVLPSTHRDGKLDSVRIEELRSQTNEEVCMVESGGVLLMRPLLLHASSPALSPSHRRVIHIEYSSAQLPDGLQWHEMLRAVNGT